ncbi:hypothetical protein CLAVI_000570 [Candidatus Clavichlamydia salmonicola]|uniref:hypothetical protein n=1 Tax=Candidatus Clavichlamydia salmonicola TaxID=469812 RepID=UPI001890C365|nr:hypothetical protein [Candidatus Clavichlamydia salmonicola]MBF5050948.1 hypothetical protein [Candidatus Clavichlamydia salmonicola]
MPLDDPNFHLSVLMEQCRKFVHAQDSAPLDFEVFCEETLEKAYKLNNALIDLQQKNQSIKIIRKDASGAVMLSQDSLAILDSFE